MNRIITKGVNISITDAMQQTINECLSSDLDNFQFFIVEDVRVTIEAKLSQSTNKFHASIRIPVTGNDLFSSSDGETMKDALMDASANIGRQLNKLKTKSQKFKSKSREESDFEETEDFDS
jgi:ribosomal subunit interface protein